MPAECERSHQQHQISQSLSAFFIDWWIDAEKKVVRNKEITKADFFLPEEEFRKENVSLTGPEIFL